MNLRATVLGRLNLFHIVLRESRWTFGRRFKKILPKNKNKKIIMDFIDFFYDPYFWGVPDIFLAPGGFKQLREACRIHFHPSWYRKSFRVPSYDQKPYGGGIFLNVSGFSKFSSWPPGPFEPISTSKNLQHLKC